MKQAIIILMILSTFLFAVPTRNVTIDNVTTEELHAYDPPKAAKYTVGALLLTWVVVMARGVK